MSKSHDAAVFPPYSFRAFSEARWRALSGAIFTVMPSPPVCSTAFVTFAE